MSEITVQVIIAGNKYEKVTLDKKAAFLNTSIKNAAAEADEADEFGFSLPNVTKAQLEIVMEWCEHYKDKSEKEKGESEEGEFEHDAEFDTAFLQKILKTEDPTKTINDDLLCELLMAVNYLENRPLLSLLMQRIVTCIRGKEIDEIKTENGVCTTCHVETPLEEGERPDKCKHGLLKCAYTKKEVEELMRVKPYEEWVKEVEKGQPTK